MGATTSRICLLLAVAAAGCGRVGFDASDASSCTTGCGDARTPDASGPDGALDGGALDDGALDASHDASSDGGTDASAVTCASLSGRACTVSEACRVATLSTTDIADCCPMGACLDRTSKLVCEAARAPSSLAVDGVTSDWAGATTWPITKVAVGMAPTAADFSGQFSVLWDDTSVYFLVTVTDSVLRPIEGAMPWQDDTIEIYLDTDLTTLNASWDADESWGYLEQDGTVVIGDSASMVLPSVAAFGTTPTGWYFEVSFDWPGAAPAPGSLIGFDVALNDHDGAAGSSRQNQLFWNDETGRLARDASLIGLLRLSGSTTSSGLPICGDGACGPGENATNCGVDCP